MSLLGICEEKDAVSVGKTSGFDLSFAIRKILLHKIKAEEEANKMTTIGLLDNLLDDPILGISSSEIMDEQPDNKMDLLSASLQESGLLGLENEVRLANGSQQRVFIHFCKTIGSR